MKRYWQHFKALLKHKWLVLRECWKRGLYWRGLVHDLSRFRPSEFLPLARALYNPDGTPTDPSSVSTNPDYRRACLLHCHRNTHHPENWVLPRHEVEGSNGNLLRAEVLPMNERDAIEAVCDLIAVVEANNGSLSEAFDKIQTLPMHTFTRDRILKTLAEALDDHLRGS